MFEKKGHVKAITAASIYINTIAVSGLSKIWEQRRRNPVVILMCTCYNFILEYIA